MKKKKILWVGEFTGTNSGYANYSKNILSRLYQTGKYQIAELACFGTLGHVQQNQSPWKIYSNLPNGDYEESIFGANEHNKFGAFKFNAVACDFRPDVVIDARDWWMLSFEELTPLRPYYKWLIMPPIDSIPQPQQFLSTYKNSDDLLSYTDWGKEELLAKSVQVGGVSSPAANYDVFMPLSQTKCRDYLGIDHSDIIVLSVMRNQKRKQFPDLIKAFSMLLDSNNLSKDIKSHLKLYLHCQYPDVGWDLPKYLLGEKCIKNVILTYQCRKCQSTFADYFKDGRSFCKKCADFTAYTAGSSFGVSEQNMSTVFNAADLYVQYSSCEGFGMPIVEAAACGLKTFGVDYSATQEVVKNCGGTVIKARSMFHEGDGELERSLPDNEDLVTKLEREIINRHLLVAQKNSISRMTREFYNYEKATKVWEERIDKIGWGSWDAPIRLNDRMEIPMDGDIKEFVANAIRYVAGRPELLNSYWEKDIVQSLIFGVTASVRGMYNSDLSCIADKVEKKTFSKEDFINMCEELRVDKNRWEKNRCQK